MRVRAIKLGFDNFVRRRPGTEFELPPGMSVSLKWMEPVDDEAKAAFVAMEEKQAALAAEAGGKFKGPAQLKKDREEAKKKHAEKLALAKKASAEATLSGMQGKKKPVAHELV